MPTPSASVCLRSSLVLLFLAGACKDEAPGEELPDEGMFTSGTTASISTTGVPGTATTADTEVPGTSGTGQTSDEEVETSSTTDLPPLDGSSEGSTSAVESTSTGTSTPTTVTPDESSSSDATTVDLPGESTEGGEASTESGDPDPGCGNGIAEANEVCFLTNPQTFTLGDAVNPVDIVEGDFDDDGAPDIATANADGTVVVLFGNGNGTFGPPVGPFTVGDNPVRIRSAQLDGQPGTDLVVLNRGDESGNGSFTVLLSDGNGDFDTATYEVGPLPSDLELAPLNTTSPTPTRPPDVVIGGEGAMVEDELDSRIWIAVNNGDGTFVTPQGYQLAFRAPVTEPYPILGVAVGSFGDSPALDVLAIGSNRWIANAGTGTGALGTPSAAELFAATGQLHRADSADFNGDAGGDAVVLNGTTQVLVMPVQANARFRANITLAVQNPTEAIFGDVAGDDSIDVIVSQSGGTVAVFLGDGQTIQTTSAALEAGTTPTGVAVADLNGDGVEDIIVCNDAGGSTEDSVTVLLSDP